MRSKERMGFFVFGEYAAHATGGLQTFIYRVALFSLFPLHFSPFMHNLNPTKASLMASVSMKT
jgi:hypothetical protein